MKRYSLIVIGAGAGGLVVAIGAAKAGKKVLLIERGHFGGDCTNFGCIPSKSLIASAHIAHAIKSAEKFGIKIPSHEIQADQCLDHVRSIRAEIRSHEDPPALEQLGIDILVGTAQFINPIQLNIVEHQKNVSALNIVIAAGSSPFIPEIPGLKNTPFLTNETLFELPALPKSLAVIGAGPIGCEMAQAFQRLGTQVILIHRHEQLLGKEEKEAQELISKQFRDEGIECYLGCDTESVNYENGKFTIKIKGAADATLFSEQLLVSSGRLPNISSLQLQNAGIIFSEKGIPVDAYGRTNQKHIWAIGDIAGKPFFTHNAEHQARAVLTSLLLPFKKKLDQKQSIPRVTFTDPEIASIGLSESEVYSKFSKSKIAVYVVPLTQNDRAITASRTEGFIKIITLKWSSKILGATIAAPRAGEMLMQVSLAMHAKVPLRKMAGLIYPYPIFSQAIRKASDLWLTQTVLPSVRKLFTGKFS